MSSMARSCVAVLAWSLIAVPLLAGRKTDRQKLPVNQDDYKEVQKFVNEGHEPWRQDAEPVAAEQVLTLEHTPQQDWNVFAVPLIRIEETERKAVFTYDSKVYPGVSYRVTVERPIWLLPLAKKWEWMIWVPTQVEKTRSRRRKK